jgi:hypothetical protein
MSDSRLQQIWFGTLGITAGMVVLMSGFFTAEKSHAADSGISITVVQRAP